jgi:hypothetical protein
MATSIERHIVCVKQSLAAGVQNLATKADAVYASMLYIRCEVRQRGRAE